MTKTTGTETLPVLPLRDIVVFPHMIVPLFVGREKSIKALEEVMRESKRIMLVAQKNPGDDDPAVDTIYEVGTLASGQTFTPGVDRGPRSLAGAVTRRTLNTEREIVLRWDLAERDPFRILEIAGFHAAAGGSGYTSLESGRLARLDLSPLLPLDRAVLVGRGPSLVDWEYRPRSLTDDDLSSEVPPQTGQPALWRIVIPLVPPVAVAPSSKPASSPPPTPTFTD